MDIFATASILILIGFAMFHPFLFQAIGKSVENDKDARRFLQLNYILHLLAGIIVVILYWVYGVNYPLRLSGIVYLIVIIVVVLYYWNTAIQRWNLFSASIVFGFMIFVRTIREIVQITPLWPSVLIGLLSTGIITFSTFLFATTFWENRKRNKNYSIIPSILNTLILLFVIRLVWDLIVLFSVKINDQNGIRMSVYQFFTQNDQLYFSLTVSFGLILPIIFAIIGMKQAKILNNNKSFVLSFSLFVIVWFGEFLYKYFLLQYGIVL